MNDQRMSSRPPSTPFHSNRLGFVTVKNIFRRVVSGRTRPKNEERLSLPPDIWYLVAHDYLVDFPAAVAALSSTSRQFHILLRFLKFRSVSIRFHTSSSPIETRSSARRFAEKIQDDHEVINHIETMKIGHEHFREAFVGCEIFLCVPAVDHDDAVPEWTTLCYILSQPYPILKRLALSIFKNNYMPQYRYPANVFDALLSAFSLQSLREVSLVAPITAELLPSLQQIETLNLHAPYTGEKLSNIASKKCTTRTLRISSIGTAHALFPHSSPQWHGMSLERLATLHIKIDQLHMGDYVPRVFSSCCSTLTNLKIFFDPWYNLDVFDAVALGKFTALKTLTLGFNLSRHSPHLDLNSQQLQSVIDALMTLVEAEHSLNIESINLLIGDIKASGGWIDRLDHLPWGHLYTIFSPAYIPSRWSRLQEVNIRLAAKEKKALSPINRASLERILSLRLTKGLNNGLFRVLVHDRNDSDFDDFWPHSIN